jgi:hypothetical protein
MFNFFLIIALFPWVKILDFSTDVQPYTLIFSCIVLLLSFNFTVFYKPVILLLLIPVLNLLLSEFNFLAFRGFFAYLCFTLNFLVAYNFYNKQNDSGKLFEVTLFIYILCGLIQKYIDPGFFLLISTRSFSDIGFMGRGFPSLAAEPTFFAIHLCFIGFLYYFNRKSNLLFNILLFTGVFLISLSSTVIFSLTICFLIFILIKKKFILLLLLFILFSLVLYLDILNSESRPVYLLKMLFEYGFTSIEKDFSTYDRFTNIYVSFMSSLNNPFIGNGYTSFNSELSLESTSLIELGADRVTSFLGGVAYENGLVTLVIMFYISINSLKNGNLYRNIGFAYVFFVILLMVQSVPISYPLIAILFAKALSGLAKN